MRSSFKAFRLALLLLAFAGGHARASAQDPLPSWNDGPSKQAIVAFVGRVTKAGGPEFVAPPERVAVFDNDGTLWSEQPLYFQFMFVVDRVKALAPQHPEWKEQEPFKSLLSGDVKGALGGGEQALAGLMAATHAGMTTEEFERIVLDWIASAKHPRFQRPYTDCVFQPMLELLAYLRANGFKTSSSPAAGWSSCAPGPSASTASRPSRSWARAASSSSSCATASRCSSSFQRSTWSTTRRASRSASSSRSGAAR
jgi:hypothetical protein